MRPISPAPEGAWPDVQKNEWVSRALGAPAYDLDLRHAPSDPPERIRQALDEADHALAAAQARMAAARVAPGNVDLIGECERHGFVYVETALGLELPLKGDGRYSRYLRFPVRPAAAEDLPALAGIGAVAFTENRFMTDRRFPPEAVARYYTNWLEDSFARETDDIYVLDAAGGIEGFYIVRRLDERRADLLLAGVRRDERASFYSLPLYAGTFAALAARGFSLGVTEVLATNLPALNILCLFGARFAHAFVRLHKWF